MPNRPRRGQSFGRASFSYSSGGMGRGGGQGATEPNPDFGKQPGEVDYTYQGDPSALVEQPMLDARNPIQKLGGPIFGRPNTAQEFNNQYAMGRLESAENIELANIQANLDQANIKFEQGLIQERELATIKAQAAAAIEEIQAKQRADILGKNQILPEEGGEFARRTGGNRLAAAESNTATDARQAHLGRSFYDSPVGTESYINRVKALDATPGVKNFADIANASEVGPNTFKRLPAIGGFPAQNITGGGITEEPVMSELKDPRTGQVIQSKVEGFRRGSTPPSVKNIITPEQAEAALSRNDAAFNVPMGRQQPSAAPLASLLSPSIAPRPQPVAQAQPQNFGRGPTSGLNAPAAMQQGGEELLKFLQSLGMRYGPPAYGF